MKADEILEEFDLRKMLDALNDSCGRGRKLTLQEKQEIRWMVNRLLVAEKENK